MRLNAHVPTPAFCFVLNCTLLRTVLGRPINDAYCYGVIVRRNVHPRVRETPYVIVQQSPT